MLPSHSFNFRMTRRRDFYARRNVGSPWGKVGSMFHIGG
jgi:hypothetical protein